MTDQPQVRLVAMSEEDVERLQGIAEFGGLPYLDQERFLRSLADSYEDGITVEEAREVLVYSTAGLSEAPREEPLIASARDKLTRFTQQGEHR